MNVDHPLGSQQQNFDVHTQSPHIGDDNDDDVDVGASMESIDTDEYIFDELDDEDDCIDEAMEIEMFDATSSELKNDVASLMYMATVKSLFHDLFLNKEERLTADNIDIYEKHVKYCLSYFKSWKSVQLRRKKEGDMHWIPSFLAHQTFRNFLMSVSGFFHFARYMVTEVFDGDNEGLFYIPMLTSNQSSLEGRFSSLRCRGHDKAYSFGSGCYQTSNKHAISVQSSKRLQRGS